MSESSPFRTDGDRTYRWPPEPFPIEREYHRATTLLEGLPKEYVDQWNVRLVADWFVENGKAIYDYLFPDEKMLEVIAAHGSDYFPLDQEWFDNELEYAFVKDEAQNKKRQRWDDGDRMQKTRPKVGERLKNLWALTPEQRVVRYAKAIPGLELNRLSEIGTDVHKIMERLALGEIVDDTPDHLQLHVDNGIKYFSDIPMEFLEVESVVYSDRLGYAGQFDALIKVPTAWLLENTDWTWKGAGDCPEFIIVMVDYKTSANGIKERVAMQFALYGGADFIGRVDGTKSPIPFIDEYWAVNIRADGYDVISVRTDEEIWNHTLAVRETHKWLNETSNTVLSKPLKITKAAA